MTIERQSAANANTEHSKPFIKISYECSVYKDGTVLGTK